MIVDSFEKKYFPIGTKVDLAFGNQGDNAFLWCDGVAKYDEKEYPIFYDFAQQNYIGG